VELLKMAEALGLSAIAITDHDSVDAHKQLENVDIASIYGGTLVKGVELTSVYNGNTVHILGYNIDIDMIDAKMKKIDHDVISEFNIKYFEKKLIEWGVDHKYKSNRNYEFVNETLEFIGKLPFHVDLSPGPNNVSKGSALFWRHMMNKSSPLHIDYTGIVTNAIDAINLIKECGGKAILAHPAQYYEQTDEIIQALLDKIDGIECYHWSATPEYRDYLIKLCKKHNLIVTGGSDHHGDTLGSQNVPTGLLNAVLS